MLEIDIPIHAKTIHQLIEMQALANPDMPAVSYNDTTLSYKELNEKSNQLAHFLQSKGAGIETLVALSVARSVEMIIGVLGILKAGGVYIPIDPNCPNERTNNMLADSKAAILITQQSLLEKFSGSDVKKIFLDTDQEKISCFSKNNPVTAVTSDNLAYVLYTSGSTGSPKGVMVCHKSVINAYNGWKKIYKLEYSDCHLQMANFYFDVFIGDLVRALCSGGKLVLCPRDTLLAPEKLHNLMLREKINCAEFVPTVLRRLIEYVEQHNYPLDFMRLLICGSDNWSINEYRTLQRLCGTRTRVINSYGLTEATIDSTYFEDELSNQEHFPLEHAVPIGKPFPNIEVLLLDENGNIILDSNTSTAGEIYIGGSGLAKGYLNLPDLTAQKFIEHPFKADPSARLYKTGDQGRYLSDGNIEFLGRIDNQIKLRGMRIELSDIENVINCHHAIRESLVTICEDKSQHKQLVAYIVVESGPELNIADVRNFLQNRLSSYMVPSYFIRRDFLPLTPNGKLNRQSLKTNTLLLPDKDYIAPRNPIENQLVGIWKKLLGVGKIGILDDFHDLGGDSLLFSRLLCEVKNIFFVNIATCEIGKALTISELAELINKLASASESENKNFKSAASA